jgi:diguanylate cyclase (GGDEF)-like protein
MSGDRHELMCNHIDHQHPPASSLCIPMIAQGETLGLMYLSAAKPDLLNESRQQLARTVAEQVGMAIANLTLRETLQNQSIRDPLTGLFNRRYLEEFLNKEIHRAQRNRYAIGIIMMDIDHFKLFNDTLGHDAGDFVLQEIGKLLKNIIRDSDTACRYGGEEMTLILPESFLEDTYQKAEEIREAIAQLKLNYNGQRLEGLTASFGVACFPDQGTTGNAVIQAADTALYQAKAAGRNRVIVVNK